MTQIAQQAAREEFRKYVADDGLKVEYNGYTAWEIAGKIVDAARDADIEEMLEDMSKEYEDKESQLEDHDCRQESCAVCIKERPEYAI